MSPASHRPVTLPRFTALAAGMACLLCAFTPTDDGQPKARNRPVVRRQLQVVRLPRRPRERPPATPAKPPEAAARRPARPESAPAAGVRPQARHEEQVAVAERRADPAKARRRARAGRRKAVRVRAQASLTGDRKGPALRLWLPTSAAAFRSFATRQGCTFAVSKPVGNRQAELVRGLRWAGTTLVPDEAPVAMGGRIPRLLLDRRQLRALGDPAARVARETGLQPASLLTQVFVDAHALRRSVAQALRAAGHQGASVEELFRAASGTPVRCRGRTDGSFSCGADG